MDCFVAALMNTYSLSLRRSLSDCGNPRVPLDCRARQASLAMTIGDVHGRFHPKSGWSIGTAAWRKALACEHAHRALGPELSQSEAKELQWERWERALELALKEIDRSPAELASAPKRAPWKRALAHTLRDAVPLACGETVHGQAGLRPSKCAFRRTSGGARGLAIHGLHIAPFRVHRKLCPGRPITAGRRRRPVILLTTPRDVLLRRIVSFFARSRSARSPDRLRPFRDGPA